MIKRFVIEFDWQAGAEPLLGEEVAAVVFLSSHSPYRFSGETSLLTTALLAQTAPATPEWSVKVALIMITCNLFVLAIGKYAIRKPGAGPELPFQLPLLFEGFGLPELLATASLGHILGAGMILGLGNAGLL